MIIFWYGGPYPKSDYDILGQSFSVKGPLSLVNTTPDPTHPSPHPCDVANLVFVVISSVQHHRFESVPPEYFVWHVGRPGVNVIKPFSLCHLAIMVKYV
jgi:hypothetical protein